MKDRFSRLIDVKAVVTVALVGTLCLLALRGGAEISAEFFAAAVTSVITYYFTKKGDTAS